MQFVWRVACIRHSASEDVTVNRSKCATINARYESKLLGWLHFTWAPTVPFGHRWQQQKWFEHNNACSGSGEGALSGGPWNTTLNSLTLSFTKSTFQSLIMSFITSISRRLPGDCPDDMTPGGSRPTPRKWKWDRKLLVRSRQRRRYADRIVVISGSVSWNETMSGPYSESANVLLVVVQQPGVTPGF